MTIKAVPGTRDILPEEIPAWRRIEESAHRLFARYGYRELRTPVFEETDLFARGIGNETDIVAKEMYTFEDRDGSSLTLRPEATAGIVRSVIENHLYQSDPALKVYAMGPMFRHERQQRGRYRQFHQVDAEVFGQASPQVDAEVVEVAAGFLEACGIAEYEVILNSVGDPACRPAYVEVLRKALRANVTKLGPDSQRRTETNPLRVLDSKVPEEQELIASLPRILEHLCAACRDHFEEVRRQLDLLGVRYRVDHRLVRGLDYYTRTTFEVTSASGALGAQNSLLGGGRYDGLVKDLGGPDLTAIGFAAGMERIVLAMPASAGERRCDVFLLPLVAQAKDDVLRLQRSLRGQGLRVLLDPEGRSFKSRMKLADKLGARYVAIRGDDEMKKGVWTIRDMAGSTQEDVAEARVADYLEEKIHG
jgi:histidyl-tRNA synthetase